MNQEEIFSYCMNLKNVYQNEPFGKENQFVVCHRGNRKVMAWFYEENGKACVRFRCSRDTFEKMPALSDIVRQGFFNQKEDVYWLEMTMEEAVELPMEFLQQLMDDSYKITKPGKRNKSTRWYFT